MEGFAEGLVDGLIDTAANDDAIVKAAVADLVASGADLITFGPSLATAKSLIDECLLEWGGQSRPEISALVNSAFAVEKGQINRAALFGLLRLDIADDRWVRAMQALRDAVRIIGTKAYLRFYERPTGDGSWAAVTIDLASA